jgi:hypothetical protein
VQQPKKGVDIDDPLDPNYGEKNLREKEKKKPEEAIIVPP